MERNVVCEWNALLTCANALIDSFVAIFGPNREENKKKTIFNWFAAYVYFKWIAEVALSCLAVELKVESTLTNRESAAQTKQ